VLLSVHNMTKWAGRCLYAGIVVDGNLSRNGPGRGSLNSSVLLGRSFYDGAGHRAKM